LSQLPPTGAGLASPPALESGRADLLAEAADWVAASDGAEAVADVTGNDSGRSRQPATAIRTSTVRAIGRIAPNR
jgi:hypothetical protein